MVALTGLRGFAAPMPGAGSSSLVSGTPGLYHSPRGFRVDAAKTDWIQAAPPKKIPSLVTVYRSPLPVDGQQPALTVRVDDLRKTLPLRTYVKKWMQDYGRFGFDVLTAKQIKINEASAFLLDIVSRSTNKQLRQVVFLREKTAVILTCRDQAVTFNKTVQDCNQIIKSFQWTSATE